MSKGTRGDPDVVLWDRGSLALELVLYSAILLCSLMIDVERDAVGNERLSVGHLPARQRGAVSSVVEFAEYDHRYHRLDAAKALEEGNLPSECRDGDGCVKEHVPSATSHGDRSLHSLPGWPAPSRQGLLSG